MQWYYEQEGAQAGPVDEAELHRLHRLGEIQDATLIWRQGLDGWTPYRTLLTDDVVSTVDDPELNPYAPPASATPPTPASTASDAPLPAETRIEPFRALGRAFRLFFSDSFMTLWGPFLLTTVIWIAVVMLLGCVPYVNKVVDVMAPPMWAGFQWYILKHLRDQPKDLSDIFAGFQRQFGMLIAFGVVETIVFWLSFAPASILIWTGTIPEFPAEVEDPAEILDYLASLPAFVYVAYVAGFIVAMYLSMILLFSSALIIDKEVNAKVAIVRSIQLVHRHLLPMTGYILLSLLVYLAGLLFCGLGLLIAAPLIMITTLVLYEDNFGGTTTVPTDP